MLHAGSNPSLPIPLATPSTNQGGEQRKLESRHLRLVLCHFCRSLFSSHQLRAHDTARPWSGGGGAASKASAELSFNKRPFSKLFFVSVLLLLSLSLFTLPAQTTNLRRNLKKQKTHHPGRSGNPFPLVNRLIFPECDHRRRPTSICAHALPAKGRSRAHVG